MLTLSLGWYLIPDNTFASSEHVHPHLYLACPRITSSDWLHRAHCQYPHFGLLNIAYQSIYSKLWVMLFGVYSIVWSDHHPELPSCRSVLRSEPWTCKSSALNSLWWQSSIKCSNHSETISGTAWLPLIFLIPKSACLGSSVISQAFRIVTLTTAQISEPFLIYTTCFASHIVWACVKKVLYPYTQSRCFRL